ncbi:hypothetical protein ACTXT7_014522 [Hymenolepis weldensis]
MTTVVVDSPRAWGTVVVFQSLVCNRSSFLNGVARSVVQMEKCKDTCSLKDFPVNYHLCTSTEVSPTLAISERPYCYSQCDLVLRKCHDN